MFVLDVLTQPGKETRGTTLLFRHRGRFTATICDQATVAAAVTKSAMPGLACAISGAGGV
jgi:hypothetical protein